MTTREQANVREARDSTFRCEHCQFFYGTCKLFGFRVRADEVCDSFSGHRPWT